MGQFLQWIAAALIVAQGAAPAAGAAELAADIPPSRHPPAAVGSMAFFQATGTDDEPLDQAVGNTGTATTPTGTTADEEQLDQGPAQVPVDTTTAVGGQDVEQLDMGAPAAQQATEPAPASAPAAPVDTQPPAKTDTAAPADTKTPVSDATGVPLVPAGYVLVPVFPFFFDGGVFVNAPFGPSDFPFEPTIWDEFSTCRHQLVLGRAYAGSGCIGADVAVGFVEPGQELGATPPSVAMPRPAFTAQPAPFPVAVPADFPGFTDFPEFFGRPGPPPVSGAVASASAVRPQPGTVAPVVRSPASEQAAQGPVVYRGEDRTTTRTSVINRDGTTVTDVAQGIDNQSDIGPAKRNQSADRDNKGNKKNDGKKKNKDKKQAADDQRNRSSADGGNNGGSRTRNADGNGGDNGNGGGDKGKSDGKQRDDRNRGDNNRSGSGKRDRGGAACDERLTRSGANRESVDRGKSAAGTDEQSADSCAKVTRDEAGKADAADATPQRRERDRR